MSVYSPQTFGERLRCCRVLRGWSQATLACQAQTTQGVVSSLEHNAHSCTIATLQRLSAALGVSCAQLLGEAPLFGDMADGAPRDSALPLGGALRQAQGDTLGRQQADSTSRITRQSPQHPLPDEVSIS